MLKILFIQGIHNFSLKERFIKDVSEATEMEVVHFPLLYGLTETAKHAELIQKIDAYIEQSDDRFIILAHSFGGILAHCLSDHTYEKVDKILTFASPHSVPFGWFTELVQRLPYRAQVPVSIQKSCGFFFDLNVPFFVTRNPHAHAHKNFLGTHTFVPDRKGFFRTLVLGDF